MCGRQSVGRSFEGGPVSVEDAIDGVILLVPRRTKGGRFGSQEKNGFLNAVANRVVFGNGTLLKIGRCSPDAVYAGRGLVSQLAPEVSSGCCGVSVSMFLLFGWRA